MIGIVFFFKQSRVETGCGDVSRPHHNRVAVVDRLHGQINLRHTCKWLDKVFRLPTLLADHIKSTRFPDAAIAHHMTACLDDQIRHRLQRMHTILILPFLQADFESAGADLLQTHKSRVRFVISRHTGNHHRTRKLVQGHINPVATQRCMIYQKIKQVRLVGIRTIQKLIQIRNAITVKVAGTITIQRAEVFQFPGVIHAIAIGIVAGIHFDECLARRGQRAITGGVGDFIPPRLSGSRRPVEHRLAIALVIQRCACGQVCRGDDRHRTVRITGFHQEGNLFALMRGAVRNKLQHGRQWYIRTVGKYNGIAAGGIGVKQMEVIIKVTAAGAFF